MASFQCPQCQTSIPNVEQQFKYTQPVICNGNNHTCGNRRAASSLKRGPLQSLTDQQGPASVVRGLNRLMCRINFTLKRDESSFVDWQKVKVQESADEVHSVPRGMLLT